MSHSDSTIVLVQPLYAGNIGATARAMSNFGWTDLRVVAPLADLHHPDAAKRAVNGDAVLQAARVFADLDGALTDCRFVIGTSRRQGQHRPPFRSLYDLSAVLTTIAATDRVAFLFGSEEKGLTNAELDRCHTIITIPTVAANPSLNLAHAVALVLYECARGELSPLPPRVADDDPLATAEQLEGLYTHWEQALARLQFFPHDNPGRIIRRFRQLLGRAVPTESEVRLLRGIARQVLDLIGR